ncbi:cell adhesion molecule-like protein 8 [Sarcoptes scabiei]|uniref:Cell adhesion molecule-like protein 8 n=1 Tax=Sarcoptes scabiei TaxID=52283 RepID=A0A132A8G6_SARSC|nr:cell adhesion molecule-like protein 8 [Sarcoptes scabiei]
MWRIKHPFGSKILRNSVEMKLSSVILLSIAIAINVNSNDGVAPKLTSIVPRYLKNIGSKFRLVCSTEQGSKPIQFEWFHNDHRITGTNKSNGSNRQIEISDDDTLLFIEQLHPQDSGNYSCRASNRYGFDRQSTTLSVKGLSIDPSSENSLNRIN